ncbi:hypothetical protein KP509_16G029400 [Ceratopteris richardii]|uniref:SHSP domain-containing protein n=1 Tax=Ceratopteris richardii TaxID=49495 RepID=A0A8T2SXL7_CERRI|nr:hypothetical protein KP509_16G029400 [Ceratopteris richardii]
MSEGTESTSRWHWDWGGATLLKTKDGAKSGFWALVFRCPKKFERKRTVAIDGRRARKREKTRARKRENPSGGGLSRYTGPSAIDTTLLRVVSSIAFYLKHVTKRRIPICESPEHREPAQLSLSTIAALTPFFLGGSHVFDPFNFDSMLLGSRPSDRTGGSSRYARDVAAVSNTQVDWKETDEAHINVFAYNGLSKEEVKIQVQDGRVLQISGERKEEVSHGEKWHWVERAHGSFLRRFRLAESGQVEGISVSMENGVLTVTVPKPAPKQ